MNTDSNKEQVNNYNVALCAHDSVSPGEKTKMAEQRHNPVKTRIN